MKSKLLRIIMHLVGYAAMFTAVIEVNRFCPLLGYQDKEPESIRKLRKF